MGVKKCSSANVCKTPDIPWSQVFNIRFSCRKLSLGIVDDGHPPGAKVNTRDETRNFCWGYRQILLRILTNTRGLLDKWQTLLMTLTGGGFEVGKVPLQWQVDKEQWACKNGQQQLQRESGKDFCEVNSSNLINFLKLQRVGPEAGGRLAGGEPDHY